MARGKMLIWILAGVGLFASSALGDTIKLRSFTKAAPGAALTLGNVAELSGPVAEGLADVVVLPEAQASGTASVDLAMVREVLKAQPRLNMGRLDISGSTCLVRFATPQASPARTAGAGGAAKASAPVGETVKDRIAARIAVVLGADPSDLMLTFDDQADLLATSVNGRTVAVQQTGLSDRMSMAVRVYEGDVIFTQGVVRVGVQVRRDVVIARVALARGAQTKADMFEADRQWLAPSVQPATAAQAVGSVIKGRVEAGKVVMAKDVEPPIIVKKGDLVSVDCVAGSVVVGATARAKENGTDGQIIEFQSLQSKKTFQARINGNGRAVMVIPGENDQAASTDAASGS
jgi:flagella basal body P-ring formation protein FlgA